MWRNVVQRSERARRAETRWGTLSTTTPTTTGGGSDRVRADSALLLDLRHTRIAVRADRHAAGERPATIRHDAGHIEAASLATGTVAALRAIAVDVNEVADRALPAWARQGGSR